MQDAYVAACRIPSCNDAKKESMGHGHEFQAKTLTRMSVWSDVFLHKTSGSSVKQALQFRDIHFGSYFAQLRRPKRRWCASSMDLISMAMVVLALLTRQASGGEVMQVIPSAQRSHTHFPPDLILI